LSRRLSHAMVQRGVQLACIAGALIISIARHAPTWGLLVCAILLVPAVLLFAAAVGLRIHDQRADKVSTD